MKLAVRRLDHATDAAVRFAAAYERILRPPTFARSRDAEERDHVGRADVNCCVGGARRRDAMVMVVGRTKSEMGLLRCQLRLAEIFTLARSLLVGAVAPLPLNRTTCWTFSTSSEVFHLPCQAATPSGTCELRRL